MCIEEKLKICKFPLQTSVQKLFNLLAFAISFPNSYKMLKSNVCAKGLNIDLV